MFPLSKLGKLHNLSRELTPRVWVACFATAGRTGKQKSRVVVLGTGWGGFSLARDLDKSQYDVTVVSPRNHFLFTPLLPSTTVGTLEFRCIQEPVRTIKDLQYLQAECTGINLATKSIHYQEVYGNKDEQNLDYDFLVIATGSRSNTFGVPGVSEENNVFFLKQLGDARAIRNRLLECFERASSLLASDQERHHLLSFVVVGGGPTSIEFSAELYDFITNDVERWYPDLVDKVSVHLIEASDHILGSFDRNLVSYTTKLFKTRKVDLLLNSSVREVQHREAVLSDGRTVPFGLMVWSTGLAPISLVEDLPVKKIKGRIAVDNRLRVTIRPPEVGGGGAGAGAGAGGEGRVFALGDAAVEEDRPLAPLAQVANQQGKYLAKCFSKYGENGILSDSVPPFQYLHLGSMAQVGDWNALVDLKGVGGSSGSGNAYSGRSPSMSGFLAFLTWRSAYWTKTVSIANKILIPMHWFKAWAFGRDISRF